LLLAVVDVAVAAGAVEAAGGVPADAVAAEVAAAAAGAGDIAAGADLTTDVRKAGFCRSFVVMPKLRAWELGLRRAKKRR